MEKINCKFKFECPKKWGELAPTQNSNVKYCDNCKESVHWVNTQDEYDQYSAQGKCVAIDLADEISARPPEALLGVPMPPTHDFMLVVTQQDWPDEKLDKLRDILHSQFSPAEVKAMYKDKETVIEGNYTVYQLEEIKLLMEQDAIACELRSLN